MKISKENNFGLGDLHPKEAGLIYMIRNMYRFGVVEITTADGLPKQFRKREYTELVPDGIPFDHPLVKVQAAIEFMEKLSTFPQGLDETGQRFII